MLTLSRPFKTEAGTSTVSYEDAYHELKDYCDAEGRSQAALEALTRLDGIVASLEEKDRETFSETLVESVEDILMDLSTQEREYVLSVCELTDGNEGFKEVAKRALSAIGQGLKKAGQFVLGVVAHQKWVDGQLEEIREEVRDASGSPKTKLLKVGRQARYFQYVKGTVSPPVDTINSFDQYLDEVLSSKELGKAVSLHMDNVLKVVGDASEETIKELTDSYMDLVKGVADYYGATNTLDRHPKLKSKQEGFFTEPLPGAEQIMVAYSTKENTYDLVTPKMVPCDQKGDFTKLVTALDTSGVEDLADSIEQNNKTLTGVKRAFETQEDVVRIYETAVDEVERLQKDANLSSLSGKIIKSVVGKAKAETSAYMSALSDLIDTSVQLNKASISLCKKSIKNLY